MLRCRINISEVSIDEYEDIVDQVRDSFENENKQLSDIRSLVSAKLQAFAVAEIKEDRQICQTEKRYMRSLKTLIL